MNNSCKIASNLFGEVLAKYLERAKGIEPSYAAWEAAVLPLNYARGSRPMISRPRAIRQAVPLRLAWS
jgi:hypothetical protein